jgi:hypothetical protein
MNEFMGFQPGAQLPNKPLFYSGFIQTVYAVIGCSGVFPNTQLFILNRLN